MVKGARATIAVSINHIWSVESIAENPPKVNTPAKILLKNFVANH